MPGSDAVTTSPGAPDETELVLQLRRGDEAAFAGLVERYHAPMLRLARSFVPSAEVAEEVVQEAWLGVLQGIDRFEGRSSLKTWLFRILTNIARTRGERESRTVPFSSLARAEADGDEPALDPDRFMAEGQPGAGMWANPPKAWHDLPEERLLSNEVMGVVAAAIDRLPPAQRTVILLRDVQNLSAEEACNALEVSETNQRVLLHRARSKVRRELERYLGDQ